MQYPPESIQAFIEQSVRSAGRALGTHLRSSINLAFPGFEPEDYDCLNLRAFICKHVPEVEVVGRRGMDCEYGVKGSSPTPALTIRPASQANEAHEMYYDPAVWKTFTSPASLYKLFVNRENGNTEVTTPGSQGPGEPWVQIPSMTGERHLEIAKTYVDSLADEGQRERLKQPFSESQWWVRFYDAVKTEGLTQPWNAFRSRAIRTELRRALDTAGISAAKVEAQILAKARPSLRPAVAQRPTATVSRSAPQVRVVAAALIQNMSIAELRSLTVRLGDVLDALDR